MQYKEGDKATRGEEILGVLTASERNVWADARTKYFSSGINKESLDVIEKVNATLEFIKASLIRCSK